MKRLMQCCIFALWVACSGLACAAGYDLGDMRLAPIDDPYRIRFQSGSAELTKEKIAQAIRFAGAARGWKVASEAEGRMELTILVRGQHEVAVEIDYDASGYSVRYVRSVNLLYKEEIRPGIALRVIHRNYNSWAKGLVAAINNSIAAPAQVAVGFAPLEDADAVPYLREKGREVYREFTTLPAPRAFVIAPNGAWGRDSYKNIQPSFRRDVVANALEFCNRRGNGECRLYAIDDRVVWTKTNAPAASAGSTPEVRSTEGGR